MSYKTNTTKSTKDYTISQELAVKVCEMFKESFTPSQFLAETREKLSIYYNIKAPKKFEDIEEILAEQLSVIKISHEIIRLKTTIDINTNDEDLDTADRMELFLN